MAGDIDNVDPAPGERPPVARQVGLRAAFVGPEKGDAEVTGRDPMVLRRDLEPGHEHGLAARLAGAGRGDRPLQPPFQAMRKGRWLDVGLSGNERIDESDEGDGIPFGLKLSGHFESENAAHRVSKEEVRSAGLNRSKGEDGERTR